MNKDAENRTVSQIYESDSCGVVQISDDVVATIAGLAATEVEGVSAMSGNITNEIVGKLGIKNLSKGVKVVLDNDDVYVELAIIMQYGCSVPAVAQAVQLKVKNAIESMTGLVVSAVDVRIAGVNVDEYK